MSKVFGIGPVSAGADRFGSGPVRQLECAHRSGDSGEVSDSLSAGINRGLNGNPRMASGGLAQQLRAIAEKNRAFGGYTHNQFTKRKASLLFDEKEAADIDNETVYEIGLRGVTALAEQEPLFIRYQGLLFDPLSVAPESLDRSLKTSEENRQLDGHIRSFLRLCQPYYLDRCCQQALEWLVRAHRINELNVPDVLDAILPYHETPEFVRFVQILMFRDSGDDPWTFLFAAVKQGGQGVTREFLAKRACVDRRVLESSWAALKFFFSKWEQCTRTPSPAFHTMLCCEFLSRAHKVDMAVTAGFLLPMALEMLQFGPSSDVQHGGMLILGTLAERANLSSSAVSQIVASCEKLVESGTNAREALLLAERMARLYSGKVALSGLLKSHLQSTDPSDYPSLMHIVAKNN